MSDKGVLIQGREGNLFHSVEVGHEEKTDRPTSDNFADVSKWSSSAGVPIANWLNNRGLGFQTVSQLNNNNLNPRITG